MKTRDPADLGERPAGDISPLEHGGVRLDWHLVECGFPAAWESLGGVEHIDWTGVSVGHIDTGFTRHPVLGFPSEDSDSGWLDLSHDANFFSTELDTSTGMPSSAQSNSAEEHHTPGLSGGHGTRTMSVLCGYDKSDAAMESGLYAGYFGGAPKVPVVPIRLQDAVWLQGIALSDDLPAAIDHLVETAGVPVITLSMGGPVGPGLNSTTPRGLRRAIDNAYERGVIVCCAAGNNQPNEKVVYPARSSRTIAVAGTARDHKLWVGSSYGIQVDIAAPACDVRRADVKRRFHGPALFDYGAGDRTSYATPQVAACAALWLARRGAEIESAYPRAWQRVEAFKALLRATAQPGKAWQDVHGPGILDAGTLLDSDLPSASDLTRDETQNWD
jgi:subtilisin family serine protease